MTDKINPTKNVESLSGATTASDLDVGVCLDVVVPIRIGIGFAL